MTYPTLWQQRAPSLFNDIFNIRGDLDRLFDHGQRADLMGAWAPAVDITETTDEWILAADLPGLTTEDVSVSVENSVLTISGERKREYEEGPNGHGYHTVERRYGRFERSFRLPQSVNAEKVRAEFTNGVLRVSLPKAETAKPRKIEVKVK